MGFSRSDRLDCPCSTLMLSPCCRRVKRLSILVVTGLLLVKLLRAGDSYDCQRLLKVKTVRKIRITRYCNGELRIAASNLPSVPAKSGAEGRLVCSGSNDLAEPPPLVNGSELETDAPVGVSGFGSLPKRVCRFTSEARKTLQRCGAAMDSVASCPQEIVFFTGTLPGTGAEQYLALAQWSSWVVHRLKAWVARRVPAKYDFYCWELQKRGALHLHYAVFVPDESVRRSLLRDFREEWIRLLDSICEFAGIDLYRNTARGFSHAHDKKHVRAVAELVNKSVARYLGKYLGKTASPGVSSSKFPPARWYGVSRPLRDLEKSLRINSEYYYSNYSDFFAVLEDLSAMLPAISEVSHFWRTKITGFISGVCYGVSSDVVGFVFDKINLRGFMERKVSDYLYQRVSGLGELLEQIEYRHPNWCETFRSSYRSGRYWSDFIEAAPIGSHDYAALQRLYSFCVNLCDAAGSGRVYGRDRLSPAQSAILIAGCNRVIESILPLFDAAYEAVLVDSFPIDGFD